MQISRKFQQIFDRILLKFRDSSGARMFKSCRSRKTLQNEYLVVKIGVDTAENGLSEVEVGPGRSPAVKVWDEVGELLPRYIFYRDDELLDVNWNYGQVSNYDVRIWVERHIIQG